MFKLQRLEITGFKSFADYTEIVFTGNGITAVVGPNGCGKSNVSDSISWVLGEQRAKSLRGGEMKDVVFQGTKNRKPSGMAEVVLHLVRDEDTFDIDDDELEDIDETLNAIDDHAVNVDLLEADSVCAIAENGIATNGNVEIKTNGFHSDENIVVEKIQAAQAGSIQTVERVVKTKRHWRPRSFALDFAPGEAVSVTRRLYLSGESEYLLNGKTCRLRDIQDLFAGTGLSGAHYAIVEQGRIGQILSAKPADRRNLIEEAAGISKFRTRQRAAESRLESAKSNLSRISDIVTEIEKQANSLRRQAAKTRRFIILQDEFRVLLRQLFAAEGKHLSALIERLEGELATATDVERSFAVRVNEQEEAFRGSTQKARDAEEGLAEIRRQHAQNALERDRAEREHRYQTEQIANLESRSESLAIGLDAATERLRLAETELKRLKHEEEGETAEARIAERVLVEAEGLFAAKVEDVRRIESELEASRAELLQHTAAAERFRETELHLSSNRRRLNEKTEGLERERKRAIEAHEQYVAEAASVLEELEAERVKHDGMIVEKQELLAAAADARAVLRQSEESQKQAQQEYSRAKHRLETLQELDETRAVYIPEVQKLFAEQAAIGVSLRGVIADFLSVEPGVEKAIENLFGVYLQTVIVNSAHEARKIAEWLRSSKAGRIATLVLPDMESISARSPIAGSSKIADLLGASAPILESMTEIFPREMSAVLVEDFDEATDADAVLINREGDFLIGGRLLVSGTPTTGEKNASLLAFKRELSVLAGTVAELEAVLSAAEARTSADRSSLAENEEMIIDLQSVIIKVERHIVTLEMREQSVKQDIERSERHQRVIADEQEQAAAELAEIERRIDEATSNLKAAQTEQSTAQTNLDRIADILLKARAVAEGKNEVLNQKRTIAATSGERLRSVQSAVRRVMNEMKELEGRIGSLNAELAETATKISDLRSSAAAIAGKIALVDNDVTKESDELTAAIELLKSARENADLLSAELAELNHRSVDATNARASIEVRQAEAVTQLKNITENCSQELGISLAELSDTETIDPALDLEATRERADELRRRLEGFGAINMLAVEELAEADERLLFLTSQRQDIIDSIASAEEALREIKERSRERFKHAFGAINANFVEFFSELFGGGRGEMTLLDSEDILEAGIEVVAQPPGKRLQNILLLSGGEKAMTAIALVLAIFKYRPSPFCLLDEVDAPLDDANVGRFVNKIAEMSEKTQFIVITHNKRTMEAARALYGVTMQEAGVSKVVSVKFD